VLAELPILSVDEIIDRIDAVEVDDLRELAGELFACERLSVAGVGAQESVFREALAPLQGATS
jgi:predicted Zn-dependent peptidase